MKRTWWSSSFIRRDGPAPLTFQNLYNRINWGRFWNREKSFKRSAKVDKVATIVFKLKPMASTWKPAATRCMFSCEWPRHSFRNVHPYFEKKHSFDLVDFMCFILVIHLCHGVRARQTIFFPSPTLVHGIMVQKRIWDKYTRFKVEDAFFCKGRPCHQPSKLQRDLNIKNDCRTVLWMTAGSHMRSQPTRRTSAAAQEKTTWN